MSDPLHVIGAGPVGSLLALMLARRGFDVAVHERRPDLRKERLSAGRSINLAVSTRGLHALGQVGLMDEVLAASIPMRGRMMHAVSGETRFHAYGSEGEFIHSMSRGGLNALLLDAAERAQAAGGGEVSLQFRSKLLGYDVASGEARFSSDGLGQSLGQARDEIVRTRTLFGTDGSASALRDAVCAQRGIACSEEKLDAGYKELALPARASTSANEPGAMPGALSDRDRGGAKDLFLLEPNALHIWPRGSFMLIALPNCDGSFTCTLFLPFRASASAPGFDQLETPAQVDAFFAAFFPDVRALMPDLLAQFAAAPLGSMVTVRAARFNAGRALLLGDAAHAIVPFFGQGMNAGFEDCALFDAQLGIALNRAGGGPDARALDWPALFEAFSDSRKADADAIAELALENFVEMRDRVADPHFLLQRAVEAELQKRLPDYRTRYQLVTFSQIPYRRALEAGVLQAGILGRACNGKSALGEVDLDRTAREMEATLLPLLRSWSRPA